MSSSQRDVWRIARAGSLDRLQRVRETLGPPGPGQARVAVKAIGLNFADIFACLGLYSATPRGAFIPGLEFAGVIEEIGVGAATPAPASLVLTAGTRVTGLTRFGGYATRLNVDTGYLRPIPENWSYEHGAAFPVQALTAWYGLVRLARVARNEVVLVHSAAGGVGLNALQILRATGARVIGTVGAATKRDVLAANGALDPGQVIVRDRRRFAQQLDHALAVLHADGLDVAFDAITGPYFMPAWTRLRTEGRHVVYGAAEYMPPGARPDYLRLLPRYLRRPWLDPLQMIAQNRALLAFNLIWLWQAADRLADAYDAVSHLVTTPPFVGRTFDFAETPQALRWLQSGTSVGKVVVRVADGNAE